MEEVDEVPPVETVVPVDAELPGGSSSLPWDLLLSLWVAFRGNFPSDLHGVLDSFIAGVLLLVCGQILVLLVGVAGRAWSVRSQASWLSAQRVGRKLLFTDFVLALLFALLMMDALPPTPVVFSLGLASMLALRFLVAWPIMRNLQMLVDAAHRIGRNSLDFELPASSGDEFGILTEAFNEMIGGLRERERSRAAIERYMSPKVYKLIQTGELQLGGITRELTLCRTGIIDFAVLSRGMRPTELLQFLNLYFTAMVTTVHKYDGEIDKYMGDSLLTKFGATEWYPDHARRAVFAAIEMVEACAEFRSKLGAEEQWPMRISVGCTTSDSLVGNVGSPEHMEYTVVSTSVYTVQRIEQLCEPFGWDILISEETYEQVKDYIEVGEPWAVKERMTMSVREGKREGLMRDLPLQTREIYVYPVLGRKGQISRSRIESYDWLRSEGRSIYDGM